MTTEDLSQVEQAADEALGIAQNVTLWVLEGRSEWRLERRCRHRPFVSLVERLRTPDTQAEARSDPEAFTARNAAWLRERPELLRLLALGFKGWPRWSPPR